MRMIASPPPFLSVARPVVTPPPHGAAAFPRVVYHGPGTRNHFLYHHIAQHHQHRAPPPQFSHTKQFSLPRSPRFIQRGYPGFGPLYFHHVRCCGCCGCSVLPLPLHPLRLDVVSPPLHLRFPLPPFRWQNIFETGASGGVGVSFVADNAASSSQATSPNAGSAVDHAEVPAQASTDEPEASDSEAAGSDGRKQGSSRGGTGNRPIKTVFSIFDIPPEWEDAVERNIGELTTHRDGVRVLYQPFAEADDGSDGSEGSDGNGDRDGDGGVDEELRGVSFELFKVMLHEFDAEEAEPERYTADRLLAREGGNEPHSLADHIASLHLCIAILMHGMFGLVWFFSCFCVCFVFRREREGFETGILKLVGCLATRSRWLTHSIPYSFFLRLYAVVGRWSLCDHCL